MPLYGYCRVSTAYQKEGSSLGDQRNALVAYGVPAENIFADEGVSGSISFDERPQGGVLAKRLTRGDTIVATKVDRLFRNASDALNRVEDLKTKGVSVVLLDVGATPVTENGVARLFFGMLSVVAEFERSRIHERTADGRAAKKAAGGHIGGSTPFGYRKTGKGRAATLKPHKREQDAIGLIMKMHADGNSRAQMAAALRAKGISLSTASIHRIIHGSRGKEALTRNDG